MKKKNSHLYDHNTLFSKLSETTQPVIICAAIGALSGFLIAFLAANGYAAIPGFGPIIAYGNILAILIGTIMGIIIGTIFGFLVSLILIMLPREK